MERAELRRYDRQILLSEIGIEGQQKLKDAAVLIVGAGGLGCPVALYLAAAGIGRIGIADHDVVDESNLHRQVLYNVFDIGKNKALTATEKLSLLNPHVEIVAYEHDINENNAKAIVEKYDLVIDGSDNFATRYLVNDSCVSLKKPLVFGSIYQFEGQVSVFNYHGGADYRALYPEPPAKGESNNCGESGVIGPLPGIVGSYMANEAIKLICGFGRVLSGKLLIIDALQSTSTLLNISNNNDDKVHIPTSPMKKTIAPFQEISMEIFEEWKTSNRPVYLIDVRESYEFEDYNIGGTNIPLYEIQDTVTDLPKNENIVIACASGSRSKIAVHILNQKFDRAFFILSLI